MSVNWQAILGLPVSNDVECVFCCDTISKSADGGEVYVMTKYGDAGATYTNKRLKDKWTVVCGEKECPIGAICRERGLT